MAVEAVVSVVINKLANLLTDESGIFEKVRDDVESVMKELKDTQTNLNNAEDQDQCKNVLIDRAVQFLGKVYRVEDAVESFSLVQTRLKTMGLIRRHIFMMTNELKLCKEDQDEMGYYEDVQRLKTKMRRFSKEIQEWKKGLPSLSPVQHQGSHSMSWHEHPSQGHDAYYAPKKEETIFKKDVEKLVKQLTSNTRPLQIISVFGEEGIGKADHLKAIYNNLEVKKKFECHALVFTQTKWSVRNLIMAIMKQVTSLKDKEKLNDEGLIGSLHGFLKDRKYLIVINDIKSLDLLKKLRGALPDSFKGSRVVITTPDEESASFADASSRYHFKPLDMEDGLQIFVKRVWGLNGSPFSGDIMEDLKHKIAESCKGTPLRIAMLAGLLSTRNASYEDWSSVLDQQGFTTKSPSFDVISFCYNDLPPHLKPCFLYLALFKKGFEIPVRRLIRLWLAEGFVVPEEGIILEDIVEGYLEELVKRNMVEFSKRRSDGSPKKCRMIGALHGIFLQRALRIGLFHLHQKSDENSNVAAEPQHGVRRVVEYTNIKTFLVSKSVNQNLQTYISFNGRKKDMPAEEVRTFLDRIIGTRGFGSLRVLDLEGVYRPRLTENLGNLCHLRYLGLRWTFLDALPSSIGDLIYLETLDIKHTHITALPGSIWNMKHLRHLCLNGARLDMSKKSAKHKAPSPLQTLCGLFVDEKIAQKIGLTLSRMIHLRKLDLTRQSSSTVITTTVKTATTTTTTTISQSSSYDEINLWISELSSLQSLRLRSKDKMGRPSELIINPFSSLENLSQLYLLGHLQKSLDWYQIPPGLKVLTLSVSRLDKDPMPTLSHLQSLVVLRLLAASYVGEEMHCPKKGFPALQVLKLWKLEELKVLTVHGGTMQNLRTLDIRCCRRLQEIPTTLFQIRSFDNFILTNMPKSFVSAIRRIKKKHTKIVENELD